MTEDLTTVVVPTVGRPSLTVLLGRLANGSKPVEDPVIVVDDRRDPATPLPIDEAPRRLRVVRGGARGPAHARNVGWRLAGTPWISFLDDDVLPDDDWYLRLLEDLERADPGTAGSQGRVRVPMPTGRRPTDWERSTGGLAQAQWITADMSYRRAALAAVGGFDERFPRAYREDSDLGLRVTANQGRIVTGERRVTHPVRPADDWVSLRTQAGNADDFLMRALHGPHWRARAGAARGRRPRHVAITAAATTALVAGITGRRTAALLAGAAWLAGTAEFAYARIVPGPRDAAEVRRMLFTSAAIPPVATWHSVRGALRHRSVPPWRGLPELVLFDRDDTLVEDVPYNSRPELVRPLPGVRRALDDLRAEGVKVGVVSNQSGVGAGRISQDELEAVNARVEELLGPFDVWAVCPHSRDAGCACRKPAPGLVLQACRQLAVDPARCVVVGDIGSDVQAAHAAGATGVLVPTGRTRREEVVSAGSVAASLPEAVEQLLRGVW